MFVRFHAMREERDERGFTLIELLVVVLIIAILAAIAIPVFLRQRQKGYVADVQSTLRNAATAVESHSTLNDGSYIGAEASEEWGDLRVKDTQDLDLVSESENAYCIQVTDSRLAGHEWEDGFFSSANGAPEAGTCATPDP